MTDFVTADWVAERLGTPEFLVIDTRFSMRHLMGHFRSAVNVPPPKLRDSQGKLLPAEDLANLFGAAGLGDDVTPVLYDGYDGRNSAMVAWALEYLGRDDVHLMDIVYDQWKEQGRPVLYRPTPRVPRKFNAEVNDAIRTFISDITANNNLKLLDSRSQEEYKGESEADEKPGHIPGAINLVWQELVGEDGQLMCSEEKAQRLFHSVGINPGDRVATYCKVGARASVNWLALRRLGYDATLYDASYAEWEKSDQPVEI